MRGVASLAGRKECGLSSSLPSFEGGEEGQDGLIVGLVQLFAHKSSRISERMALRSFFIASRVLVFTVPSGISVWLAISV